MRDFERIPDHRSPEPSFLPSPRQAHEIHTRAGVECTAPITVDPATRTYTLSDDYWALAHFSKFIKLGAHRIDSSGLASCLSGLVTVPCGLEGTAFENPDGSRVMVVTTVDQPSTFTITESGRRVRYTLPAGATATCVWRP